ncbi:F-box only protein 41-like [Gigantopelta aegis]|uniref:F-box only protein 41-like n=1 Tax=Gigantopelta aegis TaxID=1735272 RepID=UPI001B88B326|nr:F-box only protein 41-like [Gigantopelta aegis]
MCELNDDDATALCRSGLNNLSVLELNGTPVTPRAIQVIYKSCRHLKKILIVLSFADYYDDPKNKNQRKEYSKKTQALQALQSKAGLGHILKIDVAPLP